MTCFREMSREKIRRREKYPLKKSSGGRRVQGKRGELGLWTPGSREPEGRDGRGRILPVRFIL
jgi:hypothetical protein